MSRADFAARQNALWGGGAPAIARFSGQAIGSRAGVILASETPPSARETSIMFGIEYALECVLILAQRRREDN